jgi:MYXO-CTERM domain-containing protein
VLGCESRTSEVPLSETTSPIVGGNLATTCAWPTTVMMMGSSVVCTGTLVHPRVVVTAAHCLVDEGGRFISIGLGETRNPWAKTMAISSCTTHPDNDFGFCVLAQELTDIPIVPVMAPCEMSELATGKSVVEVGFGVTSATSKVSGIKKWINGTIVSTPPPPDAPSPVEVYATSGSQDGEYFGDSGGPLFFQMPDGTWRLIGEDCKSPDISAGSTAARVSTYVSVPYHVAWAEKVSGFDLTPCHDGNGWNPTAACTGFPTNPGVGVGSWTTMCQGETMLRQPTCQGALSDADAGGDWADGDDGASDSGAMGDAAANGDAGADAPELDSSVFSDSGASAGAGGSNADVGGGESDGSAGAGGTASGGSDGGTDVAGAGGSAGWDGGSGWDVADGTSSDGGVDQKAGRPMGGGCACSSVSDRSAGSRSIYGLLMLVAARLSRRRRQTGEEASWFSQRALRTQRSEEKKGVRTGRKPTLYLLLIRLCGLFALCEK